jgi:hypothetical protein
MINMIYYFIVIKMDTEAQFYPNISQIYDGNESIQEEIEKNLRSFHITSQDPTPISWMWDPTYWL